jgi:small-conductance mechanosensitive channel
VEEINLTYVVVRLLDRRCFIVPVNYFLERPFQNWSRSSTQVRISVELSLDYSAPLDLIREELKKILEASSRWDHEYWELNVTATSERAMLVRATMSAADAKLAAALRAEVRDKLVVFLQTTCPSAFPKHRTEATVGPEIRPVPHALPDANS